MEYQIITYDRIRNIKVSVIELGHEPLHIHREFEVVLVIYGKVQVSTEHWTREFQENDIICFHSRQLHEMHAVHGKAIILVEHFSPELYQSYFPLAADIVFDDIALSNYMKPRQAWELRDWLLLLSKSFYNKEEDNNQFLCVSISGWIMHDILCNIPWHDDFTHEKASQPDRRVAKIIDYIHNNYAEKLLLADFADKEGLTTTYLSHLFKNQVGIPFQEYVTYVRFEHTKMMLEQTTLTLSDVCFCCGISDLRYMNKMFQKYVGCSAREYRTHHSNVSIRPPTNVSTSQERVMPVAEASSILQDWSNKQDWTVGSRLRYLNYMDNPESED